MDQYLESNRALWNAWTDLHERSPAYDVEGFKKGKFRLHSVEKQELGDVSGKTLLHLQCHFGLDTLSWANLGATVTGVDFSDKAIALARRLSEETGIPATFVHSNVYDLPDVLEGQFDIVFTSYGVLGWLPDIDRWAQVVAHFLKPGGTFYIAEVHPIVWIWNADHPDTLVREFSYFHKEPLRIETVGSYASAEDYRGVEYGWNHTLSDYINGLIKAGLTIQQFDEYPFLTWKNFPWMVEDEQGYWRMPEGQESIPLMFTLKATK
ncbi:MAG: methyltransferase domain-containing protein [Chloroflexota bacterium]|nr:methyltransferase domain-containing protein [Chloroflexota bacterium]MDQ5867369.1 methyltransferase domain-containing protein [Chloroflexota bacterium]